MASLPRWPRPSGSKGDGPIGSCTTASSAKRSNQPSRSLACTAARDRRPSSRAVSASSVMTTPPLRRPSSCLVDDVLTEAPEAVDLRLERFGIRTGIVGPAEAHDDIGHPPVLQLADPRRAVGLGRDHVHLEGPRPGAVLPAELAQP